MNVIVEALRGIVSFYAESFPAGVPVQPQTPLSEISVGVIPSVVDMILLHREVRRQACDINSLVASLNKAICHCQKTFSQSEGSTGSNFSLSISSQPAKSRNVAIQTNCKSHAKLLPYKVTISHCE